jgi:hypothetical protein
MALFKKEKEENFLVNGNVEELLTNIELALHRGKFTNIKINKLLNQVTGDYKKLTVYGGIIITILPQNGNVKLINTKVVAATDNIYALFNCPRQKILDQFMINMQSNRVMTMTNSQENMDVVWEENKTFKFIENFGGTK